MGGLVLDNFLAWICAGLAQMEHAKIRRNGELSFPLPVTVLLGWVLSMPSLFWITAMSARAYGLSWTTILVGPFAVGWTIASLRYLPATIIVGERGVSQTHWLRASKSIAWADAQASVIKDHYERRVIRITGSDGSEIVHRAYNVDQEQFLKEAKQRIQAEVLDLG
jgi:hypothetical protein